MKKIISLSILTVCFLGLSIFASCVSSGGNKENVGEKESNSELHVCEFLNWERIEEPNCVKDGKEKGYCVCGQTQETTIPKLGHSIVEGECSRCHKRFSEGLNYVLSDDRSYYIVAGIGSCTDTDIVILDVYNELPVKEIGKEAFEFCFSITSVEISESVTMVGVSAFHCCSSLTSVVIPDSVTSIGDSAFSSCSSLTSVEIPDSVTSIGDSAFSSCSSLTSISLPFVGNTKDGIENTHFGYIFGASSYSNNSSYVPTSLKEVIITGGSTIQDFAFCYCYSLTSVEIGDSVTSIGERAFIYCESLTSVEIGDSVTSIGEDAFYYCNSLTSVEIGDSVIEIGKRAFYYCNSLTSVKIGDGVTSIGSEAFYGCNSLTSVKIGDGVTSIGSEAFYGCNSLVYVEIPDGVTSIDFMAFAYCSSLTSISLPFVGNTKDGIENTHFGYIFGASSYSGNDFCMPKSLEKVIITGSSAIGKNAFYECSNLTSVEIGDRVTLIGEEAFRYCSNLTSVEIGDSVTTIRERAFEYCSSLESVEIGDSVTTIGEWAFSGCSNLTSVVIPDSVTLIGEYAFYKCSNLTSVVIPDSVTSIGDDAFEDCSSLQYNEKDNLKYLGNSNNPYLYLAGVVSTEITEANIDANCRFIKECAFRNCSNLTSVVIGDSVTAIGYQTFDGCSSLISVKIGKSVISIGNCAFFKCSSLMSIEIPDSVTSIGGGAFERCSSLTSVYITDIASWCNIEFDGFTANPLCYANYLYLNGQLVTDLVIPDTIKEIKGHAFASCSSLTSVIIPENVTSIGDSAFSNCSSLTSVYITDIESWCNIEFENSSSNPLSSNAKLYLNGQLVTNIVIPNTITEIKDYAFYNCSSLTSVEIPDSVTLIGYEAFYNCSRLTSVEIPDNITTIGNAAFYNCDRLTSVEIPDSVNSIGDYAFSVCDSLQYNVKDNLKYLGNCNNPYLYLAGVMSTSITEANIDANCRFIGSKAFSYCSSLTSVVIGDSVTTIGSYAFSDCSSLTSVVIPDSVTSIGAGAFHECSSLTSIVIPDSVTSIGDDAFSYCSNLTSVEISDLANWCQIDGLDEIIVSSKTTLYLNGEELSGEIVIPNTVTEINLYAFGYCDQITSVVIPESVTSIGFLAFSNCSSLTSIKFNGTVEEWMAITKGDIWNNNVPATEIVCSDGTVKLYTIL